MTKRYAYTIFCDDIREEIGNKVSLIGIYGSDLVLADFPSALARFCIVARFTTSLDEPVENLTVKISLGDQLLAEQDAPIEFLTHGYSEVRQKHDAGDERDLITYSMQTVISPMVVEKPGMLTVKIEAGGTEYLAGRLLVHPRDPSQS